MKHITRPSLILFITAAVCMTLLSVVHAVTLEPIRVQSKKTHDEAMRTVLKQADEFAEVPFEPSGSIVKIFEGRSGGKMVGYVFEMSPVGYSGNIEMMAGISAVDGKVSGMRVLRHTETPGLGALAVKESFYSRYDDKPLTELRVVRVPPRSDDEIHAITSATITTKAITDAVNEAIGWYVTERADAMTGATADADTVTEATKEANITESTDKTVDTAEAFDTREAVKTSR